MDRHEKTLVAILSGLVVWGIVMALAGCASLPKTEVVPVVPEVPVYVVDMQGRFPHINTPPAATGCDSANVPRIFIDSFYVGKPAYARLLVHERTHVRQIHASGWDCTAFMARYKSDTDFRFKVEVEAECAAVASENPPIEKFHEELSWMIQFTLENPDLFGARLPEAVTAHIQSVCQKARSRITR